MEGGRGINGEFLEGRIDGGLGSANVILLLMHDDGLFLD
jgi:hypothetical protein